jgi:hypothetical protein
MRPLQLFAWDATPLMIQISMTTLKARMTHVKARQRGKMRRRTLGGTADGGAPGGPVTMARRVAVWAVPPVWSLKRHRAVEGFAASSVSRTNA